MPIYTYQCKNKHRIEYYSCVDKRKDIIRCVECGEEARLVPSCSHFIFKGDGWAKDGYTKKRKV